MLGFVIEQRVHRAVINTTWSNAMTIETSRHAKTLRIRFVRKPADLQEVLESPSWNSTPPEPVVISEVRELTPVEYDDFADALLLDRDWLAGKGGFPDQTTRHVVAVRAKNRKTLYVDPSGSTYGRYVGIAIDA